MTKLVASVRMQEAAARLAPAIGVIGNPISLAPKAAAPPKPKVKLPQPTSKEIAARRRAEANAILERLRAAWPLAFSSPPVPLAIGIGRAIRAQLGETVSVRILNRAMAFWTGRPAYLEAIVRGDRRVNLDGSPAGEPRADHRRVAVERLQQIAAHETRAAEAFRRGVEAYKLRAEKARCSSQPRRGAALGTEAAGIEPGKPSHS